MSTWDGNNFYYSGQGVVLVGDRDAVTGKPAGLISVGNVSDLKISIATTVLEHKESQTGQRGIDLRLTTETKASLSVTMENFIASSLATALRGTATTVAGATATNEPFIAKRGMVSPLQNMKVSAVVVKQASVTLTPWVNDQTTWDYKVNLEAGSIMINDGVGIGVAGLTGGLAGAPMSLTASYTYASQILVDALTTGVQEKFLRFEGLNTADNNTPCVVEVFKFSVDPLKELALISDGIQQFVLEGNVLADPLRTSGSKYFREILQR